MIIAGNRQHAAMFRRARHIGVTEHIARAIDPRPLAIPDAEHAVELAFATHFSLLAAPQGGGGQVLVQPRLKLDVARFQERRRRHELVIDRTDGRTAIARHIARGVEACPAVPLRLHERQPHDGLGACQEHRRFVEIIFVIETVHEQLLAPVDKSQNLREA